MTARRWVVLCLSLVALAVGGGRWWLWLAARNRPAPADLRAHTAPGSPTVGNANSPAAQVPENFPVPWGNQTGAEFSIADMLAPGLADEWIEFERLPGSLLLPVMPMRMESAIWRGYQMLATNPAVDAAALGEQMLSATNAWVRTTGAIWMLEKNHHLEPEILNRLLADEEAFVPLTVLGWMLDSGIGAEAEQFEARWKAAPQEAWEAAIQALADQPLKSMAGRAALWMAERSDWPEAEKSDWMAAAAEDENSVYDVRWKAAMMLRRHMDHAAYRQLVLDLLDVEALPTPFPPDNPEEDTGPDIPAFTIAMGLLNERVAGPAAVVEHPVLTGEDADWFFTQESSLMLENVALWVEAIVDQGAVDVSPGFAAGISRHLAELPAEELPANQRLTLRRIQSRLDALAQIERERPARK